MNSWFDVTFVRRVFPIAAIGAAMIYAIDGLVLAPAATRLEEERATLDRTRAAARASGTLELAQSELEERLSGSTGSIREVKRRSEVATDQRELFERVTALAIEARVDLEQVRSLEPGDHAAASKDEVARCVASGCAMELNGTFDNVRVFVGLIETRLGLSAVTRLKVRPASEGDRVVAEVDLACFAMDAAMTSAALASVVNGKEESR
jgi:hypothetical protein